MPCVDVVDDERPAPPTPVADPLVRGDRGARRVEPVADAERDADAEHEVAAGGLDVEDPVDDLLRQQLDAAGRAAGRHHGLGQGHAAGVAVPAGGGDLGPPPRDLPRLLGDEARVGGPVRDRVPSASSTGSPAEAGGASAVGGMTRATRSSCSGPVPMWKSAPSGPAISSAKNVPTERPSTRRTTSPTRLPWVMPW